MKDNKIVDSKLQYTIVKIMTQNVTNNAFQNLEAAVKGIQ